MKFTENKKHELAVILLCLCILLPLIIVGFYNRPAADDYDYALLTHAAVVAGGNIFDIIKAAWETNIYYYNNWQGLYTSAFLLALHPGIFGDKLYGISHIIIIASTYIPIFFAVKIINKHYFKKSIVFSFSFSLVLYTMLLIWMPDIGDGLYWFNGAMNYMPWAFINILSLCLLLEAHYSDKRNKIFLISLSTFLAFLTSGGNHVTAFANILLLLFALILALSKKKIFPVFPLIAACVGFFIMMVAPGTAIRQKLFESPGAVTTVIRTALHVYGLASEWLSLKWLLSLFVLTPAAIEFGCKNRHRFPRYFILYILAAVVCSIAVICGMFCVPFYAMRDFGLGRVTDVIWITFNFLSWFIYFMVIGWLVAKEFINVDKILAVKHISGIRLSAIAVGLCMMTVLLENSLASWTVKAASELIHGIPQKYCDEINQRIVLLTDDNLTDIVVPPIKTKSELLSARDITEDPYQWPNTSLHKYYGKTVSLKPES